jgi:hypothetical protein
MLFGAGRMMGSPTDERRGVRLMTARTGPPPEPLLPRAAPVPKSCGPLLLTRPSRLGVQRGVDGLVAHLGLRVVGELPARSGGDHSSLSKGFWWLELTLERDLPRQNETT